MSKLRITLLMIVLIVVGFGIRVILEGESPSADSESGSPAMETPAETDPRSAATDSEAPQPGESILEYLGTPEGPFDPVLTQAVSDAAMAPPENKLCNNPLGEHVSIVQSEVAIAVYGDTIVVGWNDGIAFVDGSTVSGYGYSVDRGETWVDGGEVPDGTGTAVYGDPTVIVTNDGEWLFASLDLGSPYGVALNRGRFAGGHLQWNPAEKFSDNNNFIDKEFLEYDAATNKIYLTYTIGQGRLSYSTDNGNSWSNPITIASGSNPNGFYPAVGIDGEVYASWVNPLAQGNARLYCRYSADGGDNWTTGAVEVAQIGPLAANPPRCFNRGFNITFPAMSVDRSDGPYRGRAYFVYGDGAPGDFNIYLTYSDDKGLTWAPIIRLNDNENETEQFWPQIHVGPYGRVSVTWFDRRYSTDNNGLCDMYVTQSVDGGITWGPDRRISDMSVTWCGVPANIAPNFGDYIEMTSDDRSVFAVWSDAREGGPDVLFGRCDDRHLLAVTGDVSGIEDPIVGDGTAWFIPNEAEFTITPEPAIESEAQLLVASLGMGLLATPQETDGVFQIGGEDLSGEVTLSSSFGSVNGTFSIVRTDDNTIDFDFTAISSSGLADQVLLPQWTIEATLVDGGPGQVNMFGTATMSSFLGTIPFTLGGTIHMEGNQVGVLPANQEINQTARLTTGEGITLHTRTLEEDGVTVDVEPLVLGTNLPPLATVRATPNPLQPSTQIAYTLSHEATGSIRIYDVGGRVVRTIVEGRFEPGSHQIPFDGRDDAGRPIAVGGYFIKMQTDRVNVGGKLFVVK